MGRRIGVIIQTPTYGGPHNQVVRLHGELRRSGWTYSVGLPEGADEVQRRMRELGLQVVGIPIHRLRKTLDMGTHIRFVCCFVPTVLKLRRWILDEKLDAVQICGLMSIHGGIAAWLAGKPVVWQLLGTFAPPPLRYALMPLVLSCSKVIMTAGQQTGLAHPGLRTRMIDRGRWKVFFPPVDDEVFYVGKITDKRKGVRSSGEEELVVIGTVGNQNRSKAHERIVAIAQDVLAARADAKLVIVGTKSPENAKEYERDVIAKANELSLFDGGRFSIEEPREAIGDVLRSFDIFILSSRAEGAPTVVLEAMACGLPVVTLDVGAVREMVEDGITGFVCDDLVQFQERIMELCANLRLRRKMGEAARARFEKRYSLEACVAIHVSAFESAVAGG